MRVYLDERVFSAHAVILAADALREAADFSIDYKSGDMACYCVTWSGGVTEADFRREAIRQMANIIREGGRQG